MNDTEHYMTYNVVAKLLLFYAAVISSSLMLFFIYQTFNLGLRNVTSNEDIRHRWNGHHRNKKLSRLFRKDAGCCGRMSYILCGDMNNYHGQSKLETYAELVELYNKI